MAAQLLLTEEQKAEFKAKFDAYDTNSDGTIPPRTLRFLLKSMGYDLTQAELNNLADRGRVTITYSEFLTMVADKMEVAETQYREAFLALDKDGSNLLCADELRQAMLTVDSSITEEDIDALIKKADFNEDGKLDLTDFVRLTKYMPR